MIRTLANVALAVAAGGAVTFVVAYQLLADWLSTALGRNVMAFMAAVAVLLSVALARAFVPVFDGILDWLRLIAFSIVAAIIWRRVWLLFQAQRDR